MSDLMNLLIEKINARGLKPASLKTYTNNFKNFKLKVGIPLNNLHDINSNIDGIIEYLESIKSTSVKKNYVNPLIMLLSLGKGVSIPEYKNAYDKLYDILNKEMEIYNKVLLEKKLTEKQDKMYLSYDDIVKTTNNSLDEFFNKYPDFKDYIKNDKNNDEARDLLIVSLYSYLPPRRSIYANAILITMGKYSKLSETDLDNNVYLIHKAKVGKFFHYGRNIVKSRTLVNELVDIKNKNLIKILFYYLKKHKSKTKKLFIDKHDAPINNNYFGKLITMAFEKYHKKALNVVLLRKTYLMKYSELDNDYSIKEAIEDARLMNHSVKTQQEVYVKNKPEEK